jgi:hypothetical protein
MNTPWKLKQQLAELEARVITLDRKCWELDVQLYRVTQDRDEYRAKYELLYHTPEYKTDTEAAFARGSDKMRQSIIAWLMEMPRLDYKVEDN